MTASSVYFLPCKSPNISPVLQRSEQDISFKLGLLCALRRSNPVVMYQRCSTELAEVAEIAAQQLQAWTEWRLGPQFQEALKNVDVSQL
jgi:hypothetical protein